MLSRSLIFYCICTSPFSVWSFVAKFPLVQKRVSANFQPLTKKMSANFQPSDSADFQPSMSAKLSVPCWSILFIEENFGLSLSSYGMIKFFTYFMFNIGRVFSTRTLCLAKHRKEAIHLLLSWTTDKLRSYLRVYKTC